MDEQVKIAADGGGEVAEVGRDSLAQFEGLRDVPPLKRC